MRRTIIPIILSLIVILISVLLILYLYSDKISLTDSEKIENLTSILIASGAIISAIFVVYSYIQTNSAFILSQKPSLLVQVENLRSKNPQNQSITRHRTKIHYRNTTTNTFNDLTIKVIVSKGCESVDISDLFRKKMNMPGLDSRQRTFDTIQYLQNKGFDLIHEASQGNSIKLKISYTFTFMNKIEEIFAQEYKWNNTNNEWDIF